MKLRYLFLIPVWLLVKVPDPGHSRKVNEYYRKMNLGEYGEEVGTFPYVVSFSLWIILILLVRALVF